MSKEVKHPWYEVSDLILKILYQKTTFRDTPKVICGILIQFNKKNTFKLRANAAFKGQKFLFCRILTAITEKDHLLQYFLFPKFLHCLILFSIFSVHVMWTLF